MKAVVLCDGRHPPAGRIRESLRNAGLFVVADGGGNTARMLNLTPDLVVGDLDSYRSMPGDTVKVIRDPDQETNDLEKALQHLLEQGADEVVVFGALGKRLDHTLKNLSVLKRFTPRFRSLRYIDRYGELFLLPDTFRTTLPVGSTVSLFPLSGRVDGICTRGLKYPLNGEALENGVRDGTSNRTVDPVIEITHSAGDLLFFITSKETAG